MKALQLPIKSLTSPELEILMCRNGKHCMRIEQALNSLVFISQPSLSSTNTIPPLFLLDLKHETVKSLRVIRQL